MKRMPVIAAVGVALTLAAAAVVLADSGSITDPKGDVKNNPQGEGSQKNWDIVKATGGQASHGRLVHTVTVAGKIGDPAASGDPGTLPSLFIDVPNQHFARDCDYRVDPVPPGAPINPGNQHKYFVFKCSNGTTATAPTGSASATQTSPDTIQLVFKRKAIGSPSKYGWAFEFFSNPSQGTIADRAPDSGFKVHHLG